ncbi:MAG TPA: hypothetical protein VGU67_06170 [Edaphobacter sp.]|nr:hypothetical protein [Edaphobacter sp.]
MRDVARQLQRGLALRMDDALHGLCQPLTVLQCRLAMGELIGGPDAMRDAIAEALVECARVNLAVGLMREMLQHELQMDRDRYERTR